MRVGRRRHSHYSFFSAPIFPSSQPLPPYEREKHPKRRLLAKWPLPRPREAPLTLVSLSAPARGPRLTPGRPQSSAPERERQPELPPRGARTHQQRAGGRARAPRALSPPPPNERHVGRRPAAVCRGAVGAAQRAPQRQRRRLCGAQQGPARVPLVPPGQGPPPGESRGRGLAAAVALAPLRSFCPFFAHRRSPPSLPLLPPAQFYEHGCDNCTFLNMAEDSAKVDLCTTTSFQG
jgi:hypothetical protein